MVAATKDQPPTVEVGKVSALSLLKKRAEREGAGSDAEQKEDYMSYDLGRLAAFNTTPVDKFDMSNPKTMEERARASVQFVLNRLFALPTKPAEMGRLADLPAPTTVLPREKPVPAPKPLTRWEKFAKEKGIQNKKKERMVMDERTGEWAPRWGYKRRENPE